MMTFGSRFNRVARVFGEEKASLVEEGSERYTVLMDMVETSVAS